GGWVAGPVAALVPCSCRSAVGPGAAGLSEAPGAVGGAQPGGGVVAGFGGAQVVAAAGGGRGAGQGVVAGGGVEQVCPVPVGIAGGDVGGVAGQGVDAGDERGGRAGPADAHPGAAVGLQGAVVDGDVRGEGGGAGGGAGVAVRVVLPGWFGQIGGAAAAGGCTGGVPDSFGPAAGVAGPGELGAAGGGHGGQVGGEARRGEPAVAGGGDDGVPRVVVGLRIPLGEAAFPGAVAVGNGLGAEPGGGVLGGGQVGERGGLGRHDQDLAAGAGGGGHRHVQGLLHPPAERVGRGQRGGVAALVGQPQAAGGGGAGQQAVVLAVGARVGGGVRGAVGVHDRHGLMGVTGCRQLVRGLDGLRPPALRLRGWPAGPGGDGPVHRGLGPVQRQAPRLPGPGPRA